MSKQRRAKADYQFVRVPRDLGAAWFAKGVSGYTRGLALQIIHTADALEFPCQADAWASVVCRFIRIDGTERPNAIRALEKAQKMGLLEHTGTALRVITPVSPRSKPGPNQTPPGSDSGQDQTPSGSDPDHNQVEPRIEASADNDSDPATETEETEEKEEKRERDRAREDLPLSGSALFFAAAYEDRFFDTHRLPVTWSDENVRWAKSIGAWLDRLGREREGAVRTLLDSWFRDRFGIRVRHSLRELAKGPEAFFATNGDGEVGGYMYASTEDDMGPPTDVDALERERARPQLQAGAAE